MAWTNLTSGTTLIAANAQTFVGNYANKSMRVKVSHPGTGPDALVSIFDSTGRRVSQVAVSAQNPNPDADVFMPDAAAGYTYNYTVEPASAVFPAPGLTIQVIPPGDGGTQGEDYGTWEDLAAANASIVNAPPGSRASTRDGQDLIFQGGA